MNGEEEERRGEIEIPDEDYDKFKNLFLSPTHCSRGERRGGILGQGQIKCRKGKGKECGRIAIYLLQVQLHNRNGGHWKLARHG